MIKGRANGAPFVATMGYSRVIDQKNMILLLGVLCGFLSQVLQGLLDQPWPIYYWIRGIRWQALTA